MNEAGPTASISPRFASASAASSLTSVSVSAERAAEIATKAERISDRAQSHFEKHRQLWTNRCYAELLVRDGARMTLRPHGMADDRRTHLTRAADSIILQRQARRLAKIERTTAAMLGRRERDHEQDMGR